VRRLLFMGTGRVEWEEVPDLALDGDGEALVRPVAATTCDLDVALLHGRVDLGATGYPFGHECVAEVLEVGPAVRSVVPGDVVALPFQISCGACQACREGRTGNCTSLRGLPMFGFGPIGGDWGGVFADLVRVPFADAMLVKVPAGVRPEAVASIADNLPDAHRTVAPHLTARPGAPVLVVAGGAESIALYAVAIALALGSERVDYVDHDPDRLTLAAALGAGPIERGDRLGRYPITVDASAAPEGLRTALLATAPDGVCTSVGIYYGDTTPVPLRDMYFRGVTFHTGRVHARSGIPEVLSLVASGRLRPELVTSRVVAWDDAAEALADPPLKLVLARPAVA
jgi:threonine dehydrogenase-like Zn-dependent dehydrogenase